MNEWKPMGREGFGEVGRERILHVEPPSYTLTYEEFEMAALWRDGRRVHLAAPDMKDVHDPFPPAVYQSWWLAHKKSETKLITSAPGFALRDFLGLFCNRKFFEEVLADQHRDAVEYYFERLASGDARKARAIQIMMHAWMLQSMFGGALSWVADKLVGKVGRPSGG